MTPSTPPPVPSRVKLYRAIGVVAVAASTGVTMGFAARWPAITLVHMLVCVLVGTWLGIPISDIVQLALTRMPPERAIQIAVDALKSLPPEAAEDATRTLLRSIPPETAARVAVGAGVVIVPDSDRPTPPTPPPPRGY